MKYFKRQEEPEFLQQNAARWNQQWAALKSRNPGATFNWYQYKGQPVNQLLLPFLKLQSQNHCAYCDAFPLQIGDDTIDHFCPKSVPDYFMEAYSWRNLYCACNHCQTAKMESFSTDLLRPDAPDYSFERYFLYNYASHEIEVNPNASLTDQNKAETTIRIFQFNYPERTNHLKKACLGALDKTICTGERT
ncbi:MAG: hypothetical protein SFV55_18740 [Haliscomenobacter sp.]|uniref:hypothetical protein n=1 Tax=Haliscomenobacter sp. TaxID=2717303 RepID=UPI0029B3226B|nr:hypothetical protein [Haliscomenobacter sp.]MDX2070472.1 hypothetical protein [Haliscomenobacter sp.]